MYYHAAHYLPVALLAAATVIPYHIMVTIKGAWSANATMDLYVYGLCAEVIISAGYLFYTYWIGMRNMMYANR